MKLVPPFRAAALIALAALAASCHPAPAPKSAGETQAASPASATHPAAASSAPAAGAASDTSLYARLGGEAGFQAIAAGLAAKIGGDGRVSPFFADTDMPAFQANFAKFLGETCGGPALYQGPDMKTVHANLGIADPQFDAMVEDLSAVLEARGVSAADRAALLARIAPLRAQIVIH